MDIKRESAEIADKGARVWSKNDIGRAVIATLSGFAVGGAQLPFGAQPFGIALLCASGRATPFVYLGVCASLISSGYSAVTFVAYTLCLLLRAIISLTVGRREPLTLGTLWENTFCEHVSHKTVAAALTAFGIGLYRLIKSGFLYYDLYGALIMIGVASSGAAIWYVASRSENRSTFADLARLSVICAGVWGLRGLDIYGISLSVLACMAMTLYVTRKRGLLGGAAVGLAAGLCVSFSYAPLFVFGALCYYFIGAVSPLIGCLSSLGVGIAWGFYIDGLAALAEPVPALVAANLLFYTVEKLYFPRNTAVEQTQEAPKVYAPFAGEYIANARLCDASGRIGMLCEGFSGLSELLAHSKKGHTDKENLNDIFSYAHIDKNGLSAEIGELGDAYAGEGVRGFVTAKSTPETSLRAISEYLEILMRRREDEYALDGELGEKVKGYVARVLKDSEFEVFVCGKRQKRIVISAESAQILKREQRELCLAVGEACGFSIGKSEINSLDNRAYMTLWQSGMLKAHAAGKKRCSLGERDFCGDSYGIIPNVRDGSLCTFISDGMGSGREAATSSGLCAHFLQKTLGVGIPSEREVDGMLGVLDGFLCTRAQDSRTECSTTLDLGVFDLVACRASFYKCGAAPTYIFRDGALFKLRSHTLPIGIVGKADIGKTSMELLPGDTVVMVSDGVTEGREECPELFDFLHSRLPTHSAEQLAGAIMKYADDRHCTDDVSCVVVKIEENI